MQFNAAVKSDPARQLKGTFKGSVVPGGVQLVHKKLGTMLVPVGTAAQHEGGNRITATLDGRPVSLAVSKFPSYQARLARALVGYLRGERGALDESEFKMELYLMIPAVLPLGIMI